MNLTNRDVSQSRQVTLVVTGTNWTTTKANGLVYRTADGNYRLRFNIVGAMSSGTGSDFLLTVQGVTFRLEAQCVAAYDDSIVARNPEQWINCKTLADSRLQVKFASSFAYAATFGLSGDVELANKPDFLE